MSSIGILHAQFNELVCVQLYKWRFKTCTGTMDERRGTGIMRTTKQSEKNLKTKAPLPAKLQ